MNDHDLRNASWLGHKLDYTSMDTFKDCPRRFYWFSRRIVAKGTPEYFVSGAAWQHALIAWYEGKGLDGAQAAILQHYASEGKGLAFSENRDSPNLCMLMGRYATTYPIEPWTPLGMEIGFELPLLGGDDLTICGAVDGYLEWKPYGLVVLENKTTISYLNERWLEQWHLHAQVTTYQWYLSQIAEGVFGTLMNGACLSIPKRATTERTLFVRGLEQRSVAQLEEYEKLCISLQSEILRCKDKWDWPKRGRFCYGGYGLAPCLYRQLCRDHALVPLEEIRWENYDFLTEGELWTPWDREGENA